MTLPFKCLSSFVSPSSASVGPPVARSRSFATLMLLGLLTLVGCGDGQPGDDSQGTEGPKTTSTGTSGTEATRTADDEERRSGTGIKIARLGTGGSRAAVSGDETALDEVGAIARICDQLDEFASIQPVSVVWLFDASEASRTIATASAGALADRVGSDAAPKFDSRVGTFGTEVSWGLEAATNDAAPLASAIGGLSFTETDASRPFAAGLAGLEALDAARADGAMTVVVLVTGSAGDDIDQADDVAIRARRDSTPIFVVGYPAPFGLTKLVAAGGMGAGGGMAGASPVRGPETPEPEFIPFQLPGEAPGPAIMDSGFGPWGLERICRAAGGSFLAIRPPASRFRMATGFGTAWPSDQAPRFDPAVMARYAPAYVPLDEYRARVAENKAIAAVVALASEGGAIGTLQSPILEFDARDQAQLKRDLDVAQRPAALLSQTVNQLQARLQDAEKDREKLTDKRWQATFDLAMGQALATVVRVDGYNGMLAQLKTGKNFTNPKADLWVLEAADSIDTTSLMANKLAAARKYLQRVVDEHPGTPWAHIAEIELRTPIGYVWKEVDTDRR